MPTLDMTYGLRGRQRQGKGWGRLLPNRERQDRRSDDPLYGGANIGLGPSAEEHIFPTPGELRRTLLLRGWGNRLLRYWRASYRGCIFGRDSELYIERVRLVCLSNRTLRHPDRLRARARGGRGAATGATPGAPGPPRGAQRRRWLHLRRLGRRLRCAACVRGYRRVAGLQDGPDQRGE